MNRVFSIAPMLDWTDRHERYFLRLISRHVLLYTEMVTTGAILFGDHDKYLRFNEAEHPVALQLGGSDPVDLATCARIAEEYGYDEVNLNVGCPSDRVKSGSFGACLMATPETVAECIAAMKSVVSIPVTVKHRIGIDDRDSWEELCQFVEVVSQGGCEVFIVHARKAWLSGLSPKENRDIPPLHYDMVHRLKKTYPQFEFIINGGFKTLADSLAQLEHVDGVMMGREAYHNPYILNELDRLFFNDNHPVVSRMEVIESMLPYIEAELKKGTKLKSITRHILGLFHGVAGAKAWRRYLSEHAHLPDAGIDVVRAALEKIHET
ncbi:MAG: tRNA dihydrouridine(20/20a) synthase DusA [Gammaproteobacteria bacterium]|nr:tRNA dihydrouridine(20/20a) synthase DusA [Gammaproteobacteria bacterium]